MTSVSNISAPNIEVGPSKINNTAGEKLVARVLVDKANKKFYVEHSFSTSIFDALANLNIGTYVKQDRRWVFPGDNVIYVQVIEVLRGFGIKPQVVSLAKS